MSLIRKLPSVVLYRLCQITTGHTKHFKESIFDLINKGPYNDPEHPFLSASDSELWDLAQSDSSICIARTSLSSIMSAICDPDLLKKFGFCIQSIIVNPIVVEGSFAAYYEKDVQVHLSGVVDFDDIDLDHITQYERLPAALILPITEPLNAFRALVTNTPAATEAAKIIISDAFVWMVNQTDVREACYELLQNYLVDIDDSLEDLFGSDASKVEENVFATAFLDTCESIYETIKDLNLYIDTEERRSRIFPYTVSIDKPFAHIDGILLQRLPFDQFIDLIKQ